MFRITYEIITPESVEVGDAEERGFVEPRFDCLVPIEEAMNETDWPKSSLLWTLQHAELFLGRHSMEDCGRWFSSIDSPEDYQTGAQTRYSLHPDDSITPSSYARLARIFVYHNARR